MLEYLDVVNVPNITEREEQEIDDVGSTVHHRFVVSIKIDKGNNISNSFLVYLDRQDRLREFNVKLFSRTVERNLSVTRSQQ